MLQRANDLKKRKIGITLGANAVRPMKQAVHHPQHGFGTHVLL